MNEAETRAEHIAPALKAAGWGVVEGSRIRREFPITPGRSVLSNFSGAAGCGYTCHGTGWDIPARQNRPRRTRHTGSNASSRKIKGAA